MSEGEATDGPTARAAERAALRDRYVIGESEDGRTDYLVRLAPPGFVAVNADVCKDVLEVSDLNIVAWLDAPPADPGAIAALMQEAVKAINAYPKAELNLYIQGPDGEWT